MRAARALAALCAAALLLAGCGGGGDGTTATSPGTAAEAPVPAKQPQKGTARNNVKEASGGASPQKDKPKPSSRHLTATVRVPPISSAPVAGSTKPAPGVKTVPEGDNSVQEYGTESGEAERTEAAIALQGYLNARLEEDWQKACSYLARKPREQLQQAIEGSEGKGDVPSDCAGVMALFVKGTPAAQLREQGRIDEVLSLRGGGEVSGDPSYLIYLGPPGKTLYSMPMYLEGGQWKVGLAVASELPV